MAHQQNVANSKPTASNPKSSTRAWQITLVAVRRRDATHRLAQVYQLLLGWNSVNKDELKTAELVNSMKKPNEP